MKKLCRDWKMTCQTQISSTALVKAGPIPVVTSWIFGLRPPDGNRKWIKNSAPYGWSTVSKQSSSMQALPKIPLFCNFSTGLVTIKRSSIFSLHASFVAHQTFPSYYLKDTFSENFPPVIIEKGQEVQCLLQSVPVLWGWQWVSCLSPSGDLAYDYRQ